MKCLLRTIATSLVCLYAVSARAENKLPDSLGLGAPKLPGLETTAPAAAAPVASAPAGAEPAMGAAPAAKAASPAPLTSPIPAATTASAEPQIGEDGKPVGANSPESIRKLISEQPDPSLVLEPPEEGSAPEPVKVAAPPPPPRRPAAAGALNPGQGPAFGAPTDTGALTSGAIAGKSNNRLRVGRIPGEIPIVPEVSVILVDKSFYPMRIRLKEGVQARLFFTTTNDTPAAIIVEQMQIQRWVAKENDKKKRDAAQAAAEAERDKVRFEATREVVNNKITEILLEPRRGSYSFIDVISGAKGQLTVE